MVQAQESASLLQSSISRLVKEQLLMKGGLKHVQKLFQPLV